MQLRSDSWGSRSRRTETRRQRESLHGFALRRTWGIAGVTKPQANTVRLRLRAKLPSTSGQSPTGSGEFVQVMRFPKDALMRRQVAFHRFFSSPLAMKQGIFDEGRSGSQVDIGATQIVRRFSETILVLQRRFQAA